MEKICKTCHNPIEVKEEGFYCNWCKKYVNLYEPPLYPLSEALIKGDHTKFNIELDKLMRRIEKIERDINVSR